MILLVCDKRCQMDGFNHLRQVLLNDIEHLDSVRGNFYAVIQVADHLMTTCILLTPKGEGFQYPKDEGLEAKIHACIQALDALSEEEKIDIGYAVKGEFRSSFYVSG